MLKLPSIFSDNMVFQREKCVKIWGESDSDVYAEIPELNIKTSAFRVDNNWTLILPSMQAFESCRLIIYNDSESIIFKNIAIGEVWLAGGQSNMEYELQNVLNSEDVLKTCDKSNVRFYNVPRIAVDNDESVCQELNNSWQTASAENCKKWSAVGYFFAKTLSEKLGVAVGIIGCNWGGTSASAWMSEKYLSSDVDTSVYWTEYLNNIKDKTDEQMIAEYNDYLEYDKQWYLNSLKCYEQDPNMSWDDVQKICGVNKYPGPVNAVNPMRPCGLYHTMLKKVCPYTLKGFIYYQGEADEHRPDIYSKLLTALINNWREDWEDLSLPFNIVQLPMFKYAYHDDNKSWAKLRLQQNKVFDTVKNTGLAVILEHGEFNDIHPKNKLPVGERLALQALCNTYKIIDESVAYPPMYKTHEIFDGFIDVHFDYCDGFIIKGELGGFEIAGIDGNYVVANTEIIGNKIRLSSANVPRPLKVRYLWTNYTEISLYSTNGLPVAPF